MMTEGYKDTELSLMTQSSQEREWGPPYAGWETGVMERKCERGSILS